MTCRLSGVAAQMSPAEFDSLACASCFFFIYMVIPPYKQLYYSERCPNGILVCSNAHDPTCNCANPSSVYNIPEYVSNMSSVTPLSELYLDPPLPEPYYHLTQQCCEAARSCCQNVLLKQEPRKDGKEELCPATWDGWQCFESANIGPVAANCPNYIYGDYPRNSPGRAAVKHCLPTGWIMAESMADDGSPRSTEWTDYGGCSAIQHGAELKLMLGIAAFFVSVISLIPAIILLSVFRPLRSNAMFVLHRHLLISFLLSGIFYLFNCFFFIVDGAPGDILYFTNHIACRLLFAVQLRFLRLTTFSWMLAEGVYLFRLLHTASPEGESLTPYKYLCWGVPAVFAIAYGGLREIFDNEGCWVSPSVHQWIEWTTYLVPCLIALCVNVLLVTCIMLILVKKLRCDPHLDRMQYRKAVRAALMLIPVFGLHFLFTIYRIPSTAHQIINLVLDGLQGCAVSVIICYTNKSVLECISKWWRGVVDQRNMKKECRARASIQETKTPLVAASAAP